MAKFLCISGEDDYLIQRKGQAVFDEMAKGLDPFSIEIIDAGAQHASDVERISQSILEAIHTQGLFGDKKVIWVKGLNFLSDTVVGKAESSKKALQELIQAFEHIDDQNIQLLITAFPVDRRRKEYKGLEATGSVDYIQLSGDGQGQWLKQEAQALGVSMTTDAAVALSQRLNHHNRMALSEVNKLADFVGPGGQITLDIVDAYVPVFGQVDFFAAADAFYRLDLPRALDALAQHCFAHKEVRPLLSALQQRNRLLIQLKTLIEAKDLQLSASGIAKTGLEAAREKYNFPLGEKSTLNIFTQNPWYLGKLAQSVQKLSLKQLVDWQLLFIQAFEELLEQPDAAQKVMERLYIKALS